jgi:energy-coupling factor transport system permease protein
MNSGFSQFHPIVRCLYYCTAIGLILWAKSFILLLGCLMIILSVCLMQGLIQHKARSIKFYLLISFLIGVFNPLVSSHGKHVLFLIGSHPVTREAMLDGWMFAIQLFTLLMWFLSFQHVFGTAACLSVFGVIVPRSAMLFSMAMRQFHHLSVRFNQLVHLHRPSFAVSNRASWKAQSQFAMSLVQMMLTWTLEESIHLAHAMKARGYGSGPRTMYWHYRWSVRDVVVLLWIGTILTLVCVQSLTTHTPRTDFWSESIWSLQGMNGMIVSYIILYGMLLLWIEGREWWKWQSLKG